MSASIISRLLVVVATVGMAAAQSFQVIRSEIPQGLGKFGMACAVDGDRMAIRSDEHDLGIPSQGRVITFQRDSNGFWRFEQTLVPYTNSVSRGRMNLALKGDLLFDPFRGIVVYERTSAGWVFRDHVGLNEAIAWAQPVQYMATDGVTLMGCIQALADPRVYFWERDSSGTWQQVTVVLASQFGVSSNQTRFGRELHVQGDVATISEWAYDVPPMTHVGRVFVFRRVQGVWAHEQTLNHPNPILSSTSFGAAIAGHGDELFIGCPGDSVGGAWDRMGTVYGYRYTPGAGWQLVDRLSTTGAPGQIVGGKGFGAGVSYVPPTLVVGASQLRDPGTNPPSTTSGAGTIFAFERCNGVWSQRTVMTALPEWGVQGIGFIMDFDGETVVTGSPQVDFLHPTGAYWMSSVGIAAAASVGTMPPSSSGCPEIGTPACLPGELGTLGCGCNATAVHGRGCPNSTGQGARLYCHGMFNQFTIERMHIEGLPPGALTMLAVGAPSAPLPGMHAGAGVTCLGQTYVRLVGAADSAGLVTFTDVGAPPPLVLNQNFGLPFPLQALYRDPSSPCGGAWNASNAVAFWGGI